MRSIVVLPLVCAVCFGCATVTTNRNAPVTMKSGSAVDLRLNNRAAEQIWYTMRQIHGCASTETLTPATVDKSADFVFSASESRVVSGRVTERWIARGCGKEYPYEVIFISDGRGGTDVTSRPIQ
jgi:hypothetical protein